MPFYQVRPVYVSGVRYEKGMEDGFIEVVDEEKGSIEKPYIETPQGKQTIHDGDFIVTGDGGEFHRYSPEVFFEKFVLIEETDQQEEQRRIEGALSEIIAHVRSHNEQLADDCTRILDDKSQT